MALEGLERYTYPHQIGYYDANRRERKGIATCTGQASDDYPRSWPDRNVQIYGDIIDAYVEQFTLDCTNTSSENPKKITLFEMANGCKNVMDYYNLGADGIQCREWWEDIDGNIFNPFPQGGSAISSFTIPIADKYQEDITNKPIWVSPPGINFNGVNAGGYGEANYFRYTCSIAWRIDNASPYNPPTLNGVIGQTNFNTYYYGHGRGSNANDVFTTFMDSMETHGDDTPISPILPSEDTSTPGGGDNAFPDYNPYSDPIDFAGLPTGGSALATGFVKVYSPTANELQSLAAELWSSSFVNTLEKIMNDPMEAMISLHAVPIGLVGSGTANIRIGNYQSQVSAKYITAQYYTVNCGNISVPEHWASALDYSPYTNVDIFIPFVGVRPLQIDDVMGKVLTLKYNVDILTGSAVAMLKCGDSVLYTFNTQIHAEIPYTMSSYGRLVQSIVGIAGTAIGATAGGAGAIIGASVGGALGTAMTKHSDISRGGALGGSVGVMGDFTPYLIIHRPLQSLASGFAGKKGYPSNIGATLGSLSGYTVIDKVHLTGIDCTDTERDEINALLKDGVII